jgi:hypothetical protein
LLPQTVLFVVSDFIGLQGAWQRSIKIAAEKFDLNAFIVRDPVDMSMPLSITQAVLEDPYGDEQLLIDPVKVKQRYDEIAKKQIEDVRNELFKVRATYSTILTDKPFTTEIIKFFKMRVG